MTEQENIANNIALVKEHYEAFNNRDFDRGASLLADDFEWTLSPGTPGGEIYRGKEGYKEVMKIRTETFAAEKMIEVLNIVAQGEWVAVMANRKGLHKATFSSPIGDVPATGRSIELQICEWFHIKEGKIRRIDLFADMSAILLEIGVKVELHKAA